jgi:hypothetical protein
VCGKASCAVNVKKVQSIKVFVFLFSLLPDENESEPSDEGFPNSFTKKKERKTKTREAVLSRPNNPRAASAAAAARGRGFFFACDMSLRNNKEEEKKSSVASLL